MKPDEKIIDLRRQVDAAQAARSALGMINVHDMAIVDKVALDLRTMAADRKLEAAMREYRIALAGYLAT